MSAGLSNIVALQNNVPRAARPERKTPVVRFCSQPLFVLSTKSIRTPARHVDQRVQLFLVTDSLAIKLDDD